MTIDDVLCALAAFVGMHPNCNVHAVDTVPCHPDGLVNLDDILAVISAFSGGDLNCSAICP